MLFHISEEADIQEFEPRPSEYAVESVVWAIDADRRRNYLLPGDCPRVTYYAGPQTSAPDREWLLGSSAAVVAIERDWLERVQRCRLYCYHLPPQTFECINECAGYFVSRVSVSPTRVEALKDPVSELQQRGVDLRILPNLWPLRDAVVASSLQFRKSFNAFRAFGYAGVFVLPEGDRRGQERALKWSQSGHRKR